ncbi:hypothetical protein D3C84_1011620 [compost metagenome]
MSEANILQGCFAIQMLLTFFQINIIHMIVFGVGIFHILLDINIDAANCVNECNEAFEIGVYVVLNWNA